MSVKKNLLNLYVALETQLKRAPVLSSVAIRKSLVFSQETWIIIVYVALLFILASGVVNALGSSSQPGISLQPIVSSPVAQNFTETMIWLSCYGVGACGIYLLYISGRQVIMARRAGMLLVCGMVLIAVSALIGYEVLVLKCPPYGICG